MSNKKFICTACRSENAGYRTFKMWDSDKQEFVFKMEQDTLSVCKDCGALGQGMWVEIKKEDFYFSSESPPMVGEVVQAMDILPRDRNDRPGIAVFHHMEGEQFHCFNLADFVYEGGFGTNWSYAKSIPNAPLVLSAVDNHRMKEGEPYLLPTPSFGWVARKWDSLLPKAKLGTPSYRLPKVPK